MTHEEMRASLRQDIAHGVRTMLEGLIQHAKYELNAPHPLDGHGRPTPSYEDGNGVSHVDGRCIVAYLALGHRDTADEWMTADIARFLLESHYYREARELALVHLARLT